MAKSEVSRKSTKTGGVDQDGMLSLKLGKVETEFYSRKGNTRLRRLWLINNLDDELIFSSWIGPSKAVQRQKISDYLQNYLMHRSYLLSVWKENFTTQNGANQYNLDGGCQRRHDYYEAFVQKRLSKSCSERENRERNRLIQSIVQGQLPIIPGFEDILRDPVFRALEMERRMRKLKSIPLPYNEDEFYEFILPILVSFAVSKERKRNLKKLSKLKDHSILKWEDENLPGTMSSRLSADGTRESPPILKSVTFDEDVDLMSLFEGDNNLALRKELDSGYSSSHILKLDCDDVCEICEGIRDLEVMESRCFRKCICSDPELDGSVEQSASSLYEEAAKILQKCLRERFILDEYMEEYYSKNWVIK